MMRSVEANSYYAFDSINHSIIRLLRDAPRPLESGLSVLDLGCGRARLGQEIEALGFHVTGLEINPDAVSAARSRISEVIEVDFTNCNRVGDVLNGRQFDYLLAADSLEHCADPSSVLRFFRRFLVPHGCALISLPNVLVWDNRLKMILGKFNYATSGVLDRTHLRFFTYASACRFVRTAGYSVEKCTVEPGIVRAFLPLIKRMMFSSANSPDEILNSRLYRFYQRYIERVESGIARMLPGLLGFEIVILGRRSTSSAA